VVATVAVIPSPGVVDVDPTTGGRLKVIDGTDCVVDTSADEDDNNEDSSLTLLFTGIAAVVNGTTGKDGVIETASVGTSSKDVDDESAMLVESSGRTDDGIVVIAVSPWLLDGKLEVTDASDGNVERSSDEDKSLSLSVTGVAVVVNGTNVKDGVIETAFVGTSSKDVDDGTVMLIEPSGNTEEGVRLVVVTLPLLAEGWLEYGTVLVRSVVMWHDRGIVSTTIKVALTYIPCMFLVPTYEI
jgi:hypothetical protein